MISVVNAPTPLLLISSFHHIYHFSQFQYLPIVSAIAFLNKIRHLWIFGKYSSCSVGRKEEPWFTYDTKLNDSESMTRIFFVVFQQCINMRNAHPSHSTINKKQIDAKKIVLWCSKMWWVNWKEPRRKSNYCSAQMCACVWLERKTFNSAFSFTTYSARLYREPTENQYIESNACCTEFLLLSEEIQGVWQIVSIFLFLSVGMKSLFSARGVHKIWF